MTTVAVLGAGGIMGRPMARHIAGAGMTVRAWNRTRAKVEDLAADGVATVFDSPAQAAEGADIVLTMVSDADAVLDAVGGIGGALWLQMSTIGIEGTERCDAYARANGLTFVDAPVLGTKQPAEAGQLLVLASGPEAARRQAAPVFDAVGRRTMWLGEAGAGTRLKLVANAWVLTLVEGVAETFALAEGLGVDPTLLLQAIEGGPLDAGYAQMKGRAIVERAFAPSFRLALAAKDAGLVNDAATRHELDLPLFETIAARLAQGAEDHPDEDMIATFLTSAHLDESA